MIDETLSERERRVEHERKMFKGNYEKGEKVCRRSNWNFPEDLFQEFINSAEDMCKDGKVTYHLIFVQVVSTLKTYWNRRIYLKEFHLNQMEAKIFFFP